MPAGGMIEAIAEGDFRGRWALIMGKRTHVLIAELVLRDMQRARGKTTTGWWSVREVSFEGSDGMRALDVK